MLDQSVIPTPATCSARSRRLRLGAWGSGGLELVPRAHGSPALDGGAHPASVVSRGCAGACRGVVGRPTQSSSRLATDEVAGSLAVTSICPKGELRPKPHLGTLGSQASAFVCLLVPRAFVHILSNPFNLT